MRKMRKFDPAAYSIVVTKAYENGEVSHFAYVRELPDISSYADTYQDAYEDCLEALDLLHAEAVKHGKDFPIPFKPMDAEGYSGRVTLRMSRSMHADIARCANVDGVSLNQWIVEAIAQRRGLHAGVKFTALTGSYLHQSSALSLLDISRTDWPPAGGIASVPEIKLSSLSRQFKEISSSTL